MCSCHDRRVWCHGDSWWGLVWRLTTYGDSCGVASWSPSRPVSTSTTRVSPHGSRRPGAEFLALWPAALSHESALQAAGLSRGPGACLHVAVDRRRSPTPPPGVRLHRLADLDAKVLWAAGPPRVRVEEAAVDVAAEANDDFAAIAVLADAVQSRRTTASRMQALAGRSRIPRRRSSTGC